MLPYWDYAARHRLCSSRAITLFAMLALPRGAKAQPRADSTWALRQASQNSVKSHHESHMESHSQISGKKRDLEQNCTCAPINVSIESTGGWRRGAARRRMLPEDTLMMKLRRS